eukprot:CAMPEP_0197897312 /NCGR_PEP_ID=MMETSP1439-20131203/42113_1 /TAXON_ID=66791 /ORGANISM="Gonyaulax spinifera, Strain CCMP409" /LENGTH=281 /DNA_ID=CAMNT_0043517933 /DNA_START=60 /DNA_END=901 /DNA_ORIENTATION=+
MRALALGLALVPLAAGDMLSMPDGREYPTECVHWPGEHFRVRSLPGGQGDVMQHVQTGEEVRLPPCPTRPAPATTSASPGSSGLSDAAPLRYYSDWVVDTVSVHDSIGKLVSNWTVPPAPKSRGPLPGMSSVYLFNGLEDSGGKPGVATMILQPVLSYGKSGCVLNPLAGWKFTAFQVTQAGRAYCGSSISVSEGDQLQGRMERTDQDSWLVTADAGHRGRSVHQLTANFSATAAYLTLEGMVIYSCAAFPGTGVAFVGNSIADTSGKELVPSWRTEVRHG